MRKYLFAILLVIASTNVHASKLGHNLTYYIGVLDKALVDRDSATLNKLLDDRLEYGHSNGWLESKQDVIADLYNGKLTYRQISTTNIKKEMYGHNIWIVRSMADVDVTVDGTPVHLKLAVLQVWRKKHFEFRLIGRQSVKI